MMFDLFADHHRCFGSFGVLLFSLHRCISSWSFASSRAIFLAKAVLVAYLRSSCLQEVVIDSLELLVWKDGLFGAREHVAAVFA